MTDHPLHLACEHGYLPLIKSILTQDPQLIDVPALHGGTPLMFASYGGDVEVVQYLLDAQAHVNFTEEGGYTALYWAVHRGHGRVVELLLAHGAVCTLALPDGRTPLMDAMANGHTQVARMLLQQGVDIDAVDSQGKSAVVHACEAGRAQTAALALQAGADPRGALEAANKRGDEQCIQLLQEWERVYFMSRARALSDAAFAIRHKATPTHSCLRARLPPSPTPSNPCPRASSSSSMIPRVLIHASASSSCTSSSDSDSAWECRCHHRPRPGSDPDVTAAVLRACVRGRLNGDVFGELLSLMGV